MIHAEDLKADLEIYDLNFTINGDESLFVDYKAQFEKYDKLIEAISQLDERRLEPVGIEIL